MDYLIKGIAKNNKVRVVGIDAKESIREICLSHDTLPLTTMAFSRFLLAGAMMGTLEKSSNGVTMQIHCDGPIKTLFMQATPNGLIRGYVGDPKGDLKLAEDKLSLENLLGNGVLSVTKVFDNEHDFTSDVMLSASNITQDMAYYFLISEQVPTIINLQVTLNDNGEVDSAKGYLLQLLPGYDESDISDLESLKLGKIDDLQKSLISLFPDFNKLEEIKIKNICDCSKEKFANSLKTLPLSDLQELANEEVEIVCQFCSKVYTFTKEDMQELIEERKNN